MEKTTLKKYILYGLIISLLSSNKNIYAKEFDGFSKRNKTQYYYDPKDKDYIDEIINSLDPEMMETIYNNDYRIVIVGKDGYIEQLFDGELDYGYSIEGLTSSRFRKVFIEDIRDDLDYIKQITIHEIAHAYDNTYRDFLGQYLCHTSEFRHLIAEERGKFKKTEFYKVDNNKIENNIKTNREYFASLVAAYYIKPEDLKEHCPSTFEYLDNLFKTNEVLEKKEESKNNVKVKK